jgi:hypothetical protein
MRMKNYESFALWAKDQRPNQQKLIRALRKLVKKTAPKLVESVKWGNGVWLGKDWPVIFIHAERDHLQFGFFGGSTLSDPKGLLQGNGKFVKHIKICANSDIDAPALSRLIREAVRA